MEQLSDSKEFGRLLRAARGYKGEQRPAFAERLGTTDTTLLKWEKGEFSSRYRTVEQRRELAERAITVSGCPAAWFGLEEQPAGVSERLEDLAQTVELIRRFLLADEPEELRTQLEREDAFARQHEPSSSSSEDRTSAEANR
jgi:transcriptional regulator with XRE-family HTH domain